jgi:hypothetical protein
LAASRIREAARRRRVANREEDPDMDERTLLRWLNIGSVVLVATLAAAFATVIRTALSAGH